MLGCTEILILAISINGMKWPTLLLQTPDSGMMLAPPAPTCLQVKHSLHYLHLTSSNIIDYFIDLNIQFLVAWTGSRSNPQNKIISSIAEIETSKWVFT